jgi:hypothetical protein
MVEKSITYFYSIEIMTVESQIDRVPNSPAIPQLEDRDVSDLTSESKLEEPILCPHCLRTASNGIKCKGLCVADSDY